MVQSDSGSQRSYLDQAYRLGPCGIMRAREMQSLQIHAANVPTKLRAWPEKKVVKPAKVRPYIDVPFFMCYSLYSYLFGHTSIRQRWCTSGHTTVRQRWCTLCYRVSRSSSRLSVPRQTTAIFFFGSKFLLSLYIIFKSSWHVLFNILRAMTIKR